MQIGRSTWKIFLIVKDLYEPIDREQISTGVLESEWKLLNRKAVATICSRSATRVGVKRIVEYVREDQICNLVK